MVGEPRGPGQFLSRSALRPPAHPRQRNINQQERTEIACTCLQGMRAVLAIKASDSAVHANVIATIEPRIISRQGRRVPCANAKPTRPSRAAGTVIGRSRSVAHPKRFLDNPSSPKALHSFADLPPLGPAG